MKKLAALFLATVMCLGVMCLFSFAGNNPEVEIEYTNTAPKLDGVVKLGEYGFAPIHKVDYSNPEFGDAFDKDHSIDADFYATWDDDSLYLAWVVRSELDRNYGPDKDNNMWEHCCVQFILTTSAPNSENKKFQTSEWSGDYLEIGLCLADDGENVKCCWSMPTTASAMLSVDDWDFAGGWSNGVMTYECRVPWEKSGILAVGNGVQIGLTYAIGDQEDFTNVKENMVEWPDAILGGKNADAAAIFTLKGKKDDTVTEVSQSGSGQSTEQLPQITVNLPEDAIEGSSFGTILVNKNMMTSSQVVITDKNIDRGLSWSTVVLLKPTDKENVYTVQEVIPNGGGKAISFTNEISDGDIVVALHGGDDNTADTPANKLAGVWSRLEVGSIVTFNGYDLAEGKLTASNPMIYVQPKDSGVPGDESSKPDDTNTSSEATSSDAESSEATSSETEISKDESSKAEESKTEDTKGGMTWLWIVIAVCVVAGVAVGAVFAVKKNNKAE